jgi:hypothetical protein
MLATLALAGAGCDDNFGERCKMADLVERNCQSDKVNESRTNCVITDNLDCDSRLCAVYQDSSPYCTATCSSDSDCADDALCVVFFLEPEDGQFCVKKGDYDRSPPMEVGGDGGGGDGGGPGPGPGPGPNEGEGEGDEGDG